MLFLVVDAGGLRGRLWWSQTSRLLYECVGRETDSSYQLGRHTTKQWPSGHPGVDFPHSASVTFLILIVAPLHQNKPLQRMLTVS